MVAGSRPANGRLECPGATGDTAQAVAQAVILLPHQNAAAGVGFTLAVSPKPRHLLPRANFSAFIRCDLLQEPSITSTPGKLVEE